MPMQCDSPSHGDSYGEIEIFKWYLWKGQSRSKLEYSKVPF